jgi:hypothetical protein
MTSPPTGAPPPAEWPSLPFASWQDTQATLHRWTQIVGKLRLALAPHENHWWQVALYVTPRGLTTSAIPHGRRLFQVDFDFLDHRLEIATSDGRAASLALAPRSVADFHRELMVRLAEMGLPVHIWPVPVEIEGPVPFPEDEEHAAYDGAAAQTFWRMLVAADRVMKRFRSGFLGKVSPVHFFWGSFDHAVTRFSGRPAPPHPGGVPNIADSVNREAYSHEVASCGFWPGSGPLPEPAFYAYAYPEPAGYAGAVSDLPDGAWYHPDMGIYVMRWEAARAAPDPEAAVLAFFASTYAAAADLAGWDRQSLERPAPPG